MIPNRVLLRESLAIVVACESSVLGIFYKLLFERHPEARQLFHRKALEVQERLLLEVLSWSIEHLDDSVALERTLGPLGARHVGYSVTPEMYGWVGDALIDTIAHVSGAVWTNELAENWQEAYSRLVGVMLAGAESEGGAND